MAALLIPSPSTPAQRRHPEHHLPPSPTSLSSMNQEHGSAAVADTGEQSIVSRTTIENLQDAVDSMISLIRPEQGTMVDVEISFRPPPSMNIRMRFIPPRVFASRPGIVLTEHTDFITMENRVPGPQPALTPVSPPLGPRTMRTQGYGQPQNGPSPGFQGTRIPSMQSVQSGASFAPRGSYGGGYGSGGHTGGHGCGGRSRAAQPRPQQQADASAGPGQKRKRGNKSEKQKKRDSDRQKSRRALRRSLKSGQQPE
ncbi:hypothetical protein QQZ08_007175 [Neonectria magnoliae]|uniref:Uncharacterized protein n=1 Tax=Neonectria magnoliae TaxID=2732573 RepID=A0ABR1HZN0_9HYPO